MKLGLAGYISGGLAIIAIVVFATIYLLFVGQPKHNLDVTSTPLNAVDSVNEPVKPPRTDSQLPAYSQSPSLDPSSTTSHPETVAKNGVPATPPRNLEKASETWFLISLLAMAVTTFVSVAISFYLYRWRRLLLNDQSFAAPAEFETWVKSWDTKVSSLVKRITTDVNHFDKIGLETHHNIANLVEMTMTMQGAIDDREAEIKRLKSGHDEEIFRKYVRRFIGVGQTIEEFQREGSADASGLKDIQDMLQDALEECGVELFEPDIGEDVRSAHGVADNPKIEATNRPEDDWRIKEILKVGYQIRGPESIDIIIPARVMVYRVTNKGGV